MRHHHFFRAHVIESIVLHFTDGPLDGTLKASRSTETVANMISEVGQPVVSLIAGQRRADDTTRGSAVVLNLNGWGRQWRGRGRWRRRRLLRRTGSTGSLRITSWDEGRPIDQC